MEINRFIAEVAARLRAAGVDEETANRHARAFVNSIPENELNAIIANAGNEAMMQKITERITAHIRKTAAQAQPRKQPQPQSQQPQSPQPQQAPRAAGGNGAVRAENVSRAAAGAENVSRAAVDANEVPEDDDSEDEMIDAMLSAPIAIPAIPRQADRRPAQPQSQQPQAPQARVQRVPQQPQGQRPQQQGQPQVRRQQPQPQAQEQRQQAPTQYRRPPQQSRPGAEPRPQSQHTSQTPRPVPRRKPIYKPDPNADYHKFYIILACTSPLWGFAALCIAALFILAICALSLAIVLLIVGLFGGVAVGVVLALVGIIYGITQLFELPPVGMYEIGLGIMIGGCVMFLGILAYNGAVRLLPFLIKEVLVLLSFTIHKCIELYYFVKGRCADL